jgi:DNA primase catalytic core
MSRIPDDELERLKSQVDLAALVRSKGIELKPHGSKDLIGSCPFHEEDTPSFVVTPNKNLFHCMGCGAAGSVIDFAMKYDGVSFRHAALLLKEENPHLFGGSAGPVQKSTVPRLAAPVAFDADDQTLFAQVLDYYRERLQQTPAALDYLASRGISAEAIEAFGIGFADRTLGLRLPQKNRQDGAEIRSRLTKLGLYRESGHEHFNGCAVFPIRDGSGNVTEIYGRRISHQKSGIYHLYLPGPHRGIFNPDCLQSPEIILCESVIDALTFWCAGLKHVTCIYGTEGFTDDHEAAFRRHQTQRVYLAYDRDKAGDRAAERDAERLQSIGIECFRVKFPPGMDANAFALKVTPAAKSLRALVNAAEWLGYGADGARQRADGEARSEAEGEEHRAPSGRGDEQWLGKGELSSRSENDSTLINPLAANLAAETPQKENGAEAVEVEEPAAKGKKESKPVPGLTLRQAGEDCFMTIGDREYRIRGLHKNTSFEVLKVNLRLWYAERFYLDTFDFYRAKERAHFVAVAASETNLSPDLVKRDLGKVLLALESLQEERLRAEMEPKSDRLEITDEARKDALELLRSSNLLDRILSDFDRCGIVGEATNKLCGYLAAVSRKLDKPLAIIIQSTSAAGKTSLMEAVLDLMPEEERIKYSAMTGQSLYYLGETDLKHKILAIVEEEGAEKASYALKLLQSEGELTIASTGKDEQGRMKTEEYHVEGPVMIFLTTTAIDVDEELLNRCLVLSVDESREQTQAIHRLQREAETLEGLRRRIERERILDVHRNAQRLLRPLHVVNPFAPRLTFLSDRTRTRRDHVKYLTLIRTIALLHQYQRPVQERGGLRYIEATLADIEAANRLAHEVLGRSLDELPPQSRRLLSILVEVIDRQCRAREIDREQCLFTRRQAREWTGWSNTQLKVHLDRLADLEYILPHRGMRGSSYEYELLFDGNPESARPQLVGLIDPEKLGYDAKFTGSESGFAGEQSENTGPKRGQNAPKTGGSRGDPIDSESTTQATLEPDEPANGKKSKERPKKRKEAS